MVGEGVMLVCLQHPAIEKVLSISRKPCGWHHAKLQELLVPDFARLADYQHQLTGYDACFFCAGVSSVGMTEETFTKATYEVVVPFATTLAEINSNLVFIYVSGAGTDGTEKGTTMWARVKGRTENALNKLPFRAQYNFRPGFMKRMPGQKNLKRMYRVMAVLAPLFMVLLPRWSSTLREVGLAMIACVTHGPAGAVVEVGDIKKLARG